MKTTIFAFLVASTLLAQAPNITWQHFQGPQGASGTVNDFLLLSQDTLMAATVQGLRISTDAGMSWEKTYLEGGLMNVLVQNSAGEIFCGRTNRGVWRSADRGNSWQPGGLSDYSVISLFVDSTDHVYAGTRQGVLFKSGDEGGSWQKVMSTGAIYVPPAITCIAMRDSTNLFLGASSKGIYYSRDGGATWFIVQNQYLYSIHALLFGPGSELFAAAEGGGTSGIYRSADLGQTWEAVGPGGIVFNSLKVDATGAMYAGTFYHGLYSSPDSGNTWEPLGLDEMIVNSSIRLPSGRLLAGTSNFGIWLSDDAGSTWQQVDQSPYSIISLFVEEDGDIFVGTGGPHKNAVFYSSNEGKTWRVAGKRRLGGIVSFLTDRNGNLCAGGPEGVFRTPHPDSLWEQILAEEGITKLVADSAGQLYAATGKGLILRSPDNGATWNKIFEQESHFAVNDVLIKGDGALFAGTSFKGIYRSLDAGKTWSRSGLASLSISSMAADAEGRIYAAAGYVFRSDDNGDTWQGFGPLDHSVRTLLIPDGKYVFASSSRVLLINTGAPFVWQPIAIHTEPVFVRNLILGLDDRLYVGTSYHGIFRSLSAVTDVAGERVRSPADYSLSQNYPNPFNAGTTFRYRLPRPGFVSLKVYDLTGREVATLVHGNAKAGVHEIHWSAGALASGVYWYRISTGGFGEARKLVLLH